MTIESSNRKSYNSLLNYHVNTLGMNVDTAVKIVNKIIDDDYFILDSTKDIYDLFVVTGYTESEIKGFFALSGIKFDKGKRVILELKQAGVFDLKDVNTLLSLGHLKYESD